MGSAQIHVLAAVEAGSADRFLDSLSRDPQIAPLVVTGEEDAREALAGSQPSPDILVIDFALGDVYEQIIALRQQYPRLLILLVDEEADFGIPGYADDISVDPFTDGDLVKRIKRLAEERRLETLRADVMPQIRKFARSLRRAVPGQSRQQAAVEAVLSLGYEYAGVYQASSSDPGELTLVAQEGPRDVLEGAPRQIDSEDASILSWVSRNGQSRVITLGDDPGHPFIAERRFAVGVCAPVGSTFRFGVVFAARREPDSIGQQNVLMLELVCAQLATALAKQG